MNSEFGIRNFRRGEAARFIGAGCPRLDALIEGRVTYRKRRSGSVGPRASSEVPGILSGSATTEDRFEASSASEERPKTVKTRANRPNIPGCIPAPVIPNSELTYATAPEVLPLR